MPNSPTSPKARRKRRTSSSTSFETPTRINGPSRRDSQQSVVSLHSSRVYGAGHALHNRSSSSIGGEIGSPTSPIGHGAQESLADELAGAWGEEEEGIDEGLERLSTFDSREELNSPFSPIKIDTSNIKDSGFDVAPSPTSRVLSSTTGFHSRRSSRSSPKKTHSRKQSRLDNRPSSEPQTHTDLSPSLIAVLAEVETLAALGSNKDDTIDEAAEPITQFLYSIKNLGGQQAILETQTTRLITAHTSLSMHLASQSRMLQSLTYYVISTSALQPELDSEEYDILPAIESTLASIPRPAVETLSALHRFSNSSKELGSSFLSISDNLHLSRQITLTANHRLKSSKELVAELRKEYEAAETGMNWLEKGDWGRKLQRRDCASVCRDVVGEFEKLCDGWRSRLAAKEVSA